MSFCYYKPSQQLQPFVRHYWTLKRNYRSTEVLDFTFPTGCAQLLFHRGDPWLMTTQRNPQSQVAIAGLTRPDFSLHL